MAAILLKAKNIEVNHLFRDPKTDIVYIMRAHDNSDGKCLAQTPDGEFWECDTNYEVYTEQIEEPKERDPREKCRQCQGHGHLLGMPSQSCSHCKGTGFTSLDFDEDDKVSRFVIDMMERKCSKCGGLKVCNKGQLYKEFKCDHCDGSGIRIEKASLAEVVDMIDLARRDNLWTAD